MCLEVMTMNENYQKDTETAPVHKKKWSKSKRKTFLRAKISERRRRVRAWSVKRPQLCLDRVDDTVTRNKTPIAMAPRNTTQYLMDLVYAERLDVSLETCDIFGLSTARLRGRTVISLRRLQLREAEHSASQLRDDVYATPRLQYGHNHVACRLLQVADPPRRISAACATHPGPWDKATWLPGHHCWVTVGHEAMEESRAGKTSQITLVKEDTNHKRSNSNKVMCLSDCSGKCYGESM
ncbi:hypothetical protein F2P79_009956 [Pimephales promelas]|nr:hypothetical protein F2P79_009956 [Pimephales promelas]